MDNIENGIVVPISEIEIGPHEQYMMKLRFDCLVQMYDAGFKQVGKGMFHSDKHLPPQWFKLETRLTLEAVAYMDEYQLGRMIKMEFSKLKQAIEQYERR